MATHDFDLYSRGVFVVGRWQLATDTPETVLKKSIFFGQTLDISYTGSRILDNQPASRKTGPGLEAGYRIAGRPAGKPDQDQKPDTG